MAIPSEMQYPVGEELLRLEREERRFQREMNETIHLSWRQLLRRVRPGPALPHRLLRGTPAPLGR